MKINVIHDSGCEETEVTIKCAYVDDNLQKVINLLESENFRLKGRLEDRTFIIPVKDVYYIESVDEKTFIYCKSQVYETEQKLYQLDENMPKSDFVRISKSCILNIRKLKSVRPLLNGKMEAILSNGEVQIVNRHYLKGFKEKFGI